MKMIKTLGLTLAAVGMMAITAQAIPITGGIDMNGTVKLNNTSLGSATAATAFSNVEVGGIPTGSYAGVPVNTAVSWNPFAWPSAIAVTPLWSFLSGGRTYSFELSSVSIVSQSINFLNLAGAGVLNISGAGPVYDATGGDWSFTISDANGKPNANFSFTFANSQTAAEVPDGGMTLAMLGLALSGLGLMRRKLVA